MEQEQLEANVLFVHKAISARIPAGNAVTAMPGSVFQEQKRIASIFGTSTTSMKNSPFLSFIDAYISLHLSDLNEL